jgi:Protein of unknown function (DUF3592)
VIPVVVGSNPISHPKFKSHPLRWLFVSNRRCPNLIVTKSPPEQVNAVYYALFILANLFFLLGVLPAWIVSARLEPVPATLNYAALHFEQSGGRGRHSERLCIRTLYQYEYSGAQQTGELVWDWHRDKCVPVWVNSIGARIVNELEVRQRSGRMLAYVDPKNPRFAVLFPFAAGGILSPICALAFVGVWFVFCRRRWRSLRARSTVKYALPKRGK